MEQTGLMVHNPTPTSPQLTHSYQFTGEGPPHPEAHAPEGHGSRKRGVLLWGMGGTILSAVGFIGLALFEQYNGMISEMRSDLKHFNETSADFVKKDSFEKRWERMREWFKEMQTARVERVRLEDELSASQKAREEMAHELQKMRERLSFLEGRQLSVPPPVQLPAPKPPDSVGAAW